MLRLLNRVYLNCASVDNLVPACSISLTSRNSPFLPQDTNTKFRKYKSPHQRALDAEAAAQSGMSSAGSVMSRGSYMSRGSRAQKSVISKGPSIIYGTPAALSAANAK